MQAQFDSSTIKILVVDDSSENRWLFQTQLQFEGYRVLHASSGREGIEVASQEIPDLVLLDVMMPEMNGYELLRALREMPEFKELPIIMVTARDDDSDVLEGYQFGADYYITKPYTTDQLRFGLELYLNEKDK